MSFDFHNSPTVYISSDDRMFLKDYWLPEQRDYTAAVGCYYKKSECRDLLCLDVVNCLYAIQRDLWWRELQPGTYTATTYLPFNIETL